MLAAGFPESVPGHHRRPPVRLEPAGRALRRAGRDRRRLRHRDRLRCGVDEPRADGHDDHRPGRRPARASPPATPRDWSTRASRAELIAAKWKLDRDTLDAFSAQSHQRGRRRPRRGLFDNEIVPITVTDAAGETVTHTADETVRASTTAEGLAGLKPSFYTEEYAAAVPRDRSGTSPRATRRR